MAITSTFGSHLDRQIGAAHLAQSSGIAHACRYCSRAALSHLVRLTAVICQANLPDKTKLNWRTAMCLCVQLAGQELVCSKCSLSDKEREWRKLNRRRWCTLIMIWMLWLESDSNLRQIKLLSTDVWSLMSFIRTLLQRISSWSKERERNIHPAKSSSLAQLH